MTPTLSAGGKSKPYIIRHVERGLAVLEGTDPELRREVVSGSSPTIPPKTSSTTDWKIC